MCNGSGHKSVTCVVSGIPPPEGGPDGAVAEPDGVDPVPTVDHDASDGPIADIFTVAPGCSSAAAIGTVRHNWNTGGGGVEGGLNRSKCQTDSTRFSCECCAQYPQENLVLAVPSGAEVLYVPYVHMYMHACKGYIHHSFTLFVMKIVI